MIFIAQVHVQPGLREIVEIGKPRKPGELRELLEVCKSRGVCDQPLTPVVSLPINARKLPDYSLCALKALIACVPNRTHQAIMFAFAILVFSVYVSGQ